MREETQVEKESNYWIACERCKAKNYGSGVSEVESPQPTQNTIGLQGIRDRSLHHFPDLTKMVGRQFIPYKHMPSPVYLVDEVV